MAEIPTTSDVKLLQEFQHVIEDIRTLADREYKTMPSDYSKNFNKYRDTLVPSSIVIDIMIYLTVHISRLSSYSMHQNIREELTALLDSGDVSGVIKKMKTVYDEVTEMDERYAPIWRASKAIWLGIQAFAQHPSKGSEFIPE
jgi:hypothetical protein